MNIGAAGSRRRRLIFSVREAMPLKKVAAFGNSDGDFEMLEWKTSGGGPRFGLPVHHTDAKREWAYDRESHVGRLDRGLREGAGKGWIVVDMAKDWEVIYPFEKERKE
jgi:hypothetical protein